jgi:hypothetical protein
VRPVVTVLVALAGVLLLAGCKEIEAASVSSGYEPSTVEEVAGLEVKQVTFTDLGAAQVDLATAAVRAIGQDTVVPYASLIYDGQGVSWVYTSPRPLTFLRAEVVVDRIEGDLVMLAEGPPPGTRVVTVGATEVYGAELGIAGGH